MSQDDQMLSVFLRLDNFSKKFFQWQVFYDMKNIHPSHRQAHHLISDVEWSPFSDVMIPAKVFLIYR